MMAPRDKAMGPQDSRRALTSLTQHLLPRMSRSQIPFTWATGRTLPVPLLPSYPAGMEATACV